MENLLSHTLRIRHRTIYNYLFPVSFTPHRLVLRPREGPDLRVEKMSLAITPASSLVWIRNIFRNSVANVHFPESATELVLDSDAVVRRFFDPDSPPLLERSASPYPFALADIDDAVQPAILIGRPRWTIWIDTPSPVDEEFVFILPGREVDHLHELCVLIGAFECERHRLPIVEGAGDGYLALWFRLNREGHPFFS